MANGFLFSDDNSDPCEIIEFLKTKYGKKAAFETILEFPDILSVWKNEKVRDGEKYRKEKLRAEEILREVAAAFPEI